jgi:hypothetical protein
MTSLPAGHQLFHGARLKVKWARRHIAELEAQFKVILEKYPPKPRIEKDAQGRTKISADVVDRFPDEFALTIGDAIHNARTALDHMTWELVGLDKGVRDRFLKLPTGDNAMSFAGSCNGLKTPSQKVKAALQSLEVFPGGKGDLLYKLHLMDNAEKHTVLTPIAKTTSIHNVRGSGPAGAMSFGQIDFVGSDGEAPTYLSVIQGIDFKVDSDTRADVRLVFGKVEDFENWPVIETLNDFTRAVDLAIAEVEAAVKTDR